MKFKFVEIEELLNEKTVDLLFISETKIDSSFTNSIFEVSGYKLERHDRDIHGGGLAVFIRRDIPTRRKKDYKDQIVPLNQKEFSLYFYTKDHSSNLPSINNDHIV
jgi:hypothetical protein